MTTQQNPIGLQLALLAARFPSGATETVLQVDLQEIERLAVPLEDLAEAVRRIVHTRETRTYPPLAETLRRCREAGVDRLREREDTLQISDGRRPFGPDDAELVRLLRELARRNRFHCGSGFRHGPCGCAPGSCGEPTLGQVRAEFDRCRAESVPVVVRESKRVRGFTTVADVVGEVPF